MSKRILLATFALSLMALAGCLGGDELATAPDPVKDTTKTAPKIKLITPGSYQGDYAWIDSNKHGLESEFILDASGTYRLFWIADSEAVYDQRGNWHQADSNFYFSGVQEAWVSNGIFNDFASMEDDTNAVREVTDDAFIRREYTPLRQKPYWITYHRKAFPRLADGEYFLDKTFGTDSDAVTYHFKIKLDAGKFLFTVTDTIENFQAEAKFYQVGSFLATEENQQRELDSTNVNWDKWLPVEGTILKRVRAISDTSFNMWNPASFFEPGSWDHYARNAK